MKIPPNFQRIIVAPIFKLLEFPLILKILKSDMKIPSIIFKEEFLTKFSDFEKCSDFK